MVVPSNGGGGARTRAVALSALSLLKILGIKTTGGNIQLLARLQSQRNASVAIAPGSGYRDTYWGKLVVDSAGKQIHCRPIEPVGNPLEGASAKRPFGMMVEMTRPCVRYFIGCAWFMFRCNPGTSTQDHCPGLY